MGIKVSIIIPSYNRYPQNLLTLYSLQNQTFDPSKMEVILVDDGSNDDTFQIPKIFHPLFLFKFIRCEKNTGRSRARNIGIEKANGEIIVFLDAEMIVNPDFVQNHYDYHQSYKKMVLTGALGYHSMFSFIFPQFNKVELKRIAKLVQFDEVFLKRFQTFTQTKRPTQMVFQEDIDSLRFQKLSYFSQSSIDKNTITLFGEKLTGFQIPWIAFLTGNVSIRKELLQTAGQFDETFNGWGFEDWELGYRIYKLGATFAYSQNVASYHQEHPVTDHRNWEASLKNFYLFQEKHPDIDVLVIAFILMGQFDRLEIDEILKQYKRLEKEYPNQFSNFKDSIPALLKSASKMTASKFLIEGNPIKNLFVRSKSHHRKELTQSDRNTVKSLGTFDKLVCAFDFLSGL
ncbi:glycosyltransferase family 2 protein [Bacillus sp. NEB1478]|uniref:glycosyltransferase family 2 protein n=1 Tax=Bacillus sp. NEB1478 TaxID=3073816 RepID=UPI002872ECEF|nr:glycosyltransferase family 2 protein [Bacillus sp. NEB1478]WNB90300.1 glycosyltransferase family 2 protein [Bacillus sp. NEB1478]